MVPLRQAVTTRLGFLRAMSKSAFNSFGESRGFLVYTVRNLVVVKPSITTLPGFSWNNPLIFTLTEIVLFNRDDLEAMVCERELMYTFGVKE